MLEILKGSQNKCQMTVVHYHSPGGKSPFHRVFDVHDIKTTNVLLTMYDNTGTTHVTTASDEYKVTGIKVDKVGDLSLFKVKPHGVVDTDEGIGITNCSAIVSDDVRDTTIAKSNLANFEQLVGCFFRSDTMNGETALDVVKDTEVLARFFNRNDI